jgi:hypothetical protein
MRRCLLLVVVALLSLGFAPAPLPRPPRAPRVELRAPAPLPNPPEVPRFEFRMENKTWRDVFKWLADETGTPFIGTSSLWGSFTFVGPKGAKYSTPEIVAIINRSLAPRGIALVHRVREQCFVIDWIGEELIVRSDDGTSSPSPSLVPSWRLAE